MTVRFVDICRIVLHHCLNFLFFILYVCFVYRCLSFCTFYTDSDYPFGIFKLFFLILREDLNNEGRHGIIAYLACFYIGNLLCKFR